MSTYTKVRPVGHDELTGAILDAPAALPLGKSPGTHCIEGGLAVIAGLDVWGKSRPHWGVFFLYSLVLCTSSVLVSLSSLSCILSFVFTYNTLNTNIHVPGGIRSAASPDRSESLYRLSCPGLRKCRNKTKIFHRTFCCSLCWLVSCRRQAYSDTTRPDTVLVLLRSCASSCPFRSFLRGTVQNIGTLQLTVRKLDVLCIDRRKLDHQYYVCTLSSYLAETAMRWFLRTIRWMLFIDTEHKLSGGIVEL